MHWTLFSSQKSTASLQSNPVAPITHPLPLMYPFLSITLTPPQPINPHLLSLSPTRVPHLPQRQPDMFSLNQVCWIHHPFLHEVFVSNHLVHIPPLRCQKPHQLCLHYQLQQHPFHQPSSRIQLKIKFASVIHCLVDVRPPVSMISTSL